MLASQRSGSGIPLVFIHAFPLSSRMWDINRSAFSKNFEFITIDLPGFGKSPLTSDISTMENMATQVTQALDQMKLDGKIILAGLSMGGYVMLQLIKLIPERLRAVAFLSTRSAADTLEGREKRFKTIELIEREGLKPFAERMLPALLGGSSLRVSLPAVAAVRTWIESANPQAVCAALRGMAERPDMTFLLSSIQVPALVLSGEEDTVVPPSEMEAMAGMLPESEFHKLQRAGHLLNIEQPQKFHDIFLHFLKRRIL